MSTIIRDATAKDLDAIAAAEGRVPIAVLIF